ncbi:hypothetical protein D3C86_1497690 [compost metagenome]
MEIDETEVKLRPIRCRIRSLLVDEQCEAGLVGPRGLHELGTELVGLPEVEERIRILRLLSDLTEQHVQVTFVLVALGQVLIEIAAMNDPNPSVLNWQARTLGGWHRLRVDDAFEADFRTILEEAEDQGHLALLAILAEQVLDDHAVTRVIAVSQHLLQLGMRFGRNGLIRIQNQNPIPRRMGERLVARRSEIAAPGEVKNLGSEALSDLDGPVSRTGIH